MATEGAKTAQTSPPAGTGYIPGLGEAFKINLSTGQGVYTFKLPLPDGVAAHTPRLELEYVHGLGQGPFGLGWRLPLRTISQRLDFGVHGAASERFMDSGADIAPLPDGTYGALAETAFARYTRTGGGWRVEERDGTVHELGTSAAARLADPAASDRPHSWLLERSVDVSGNAIDYQHRLDDGMPYLDEVRYAAFAVRFTYEARPDVRSNGRAGYLRRLRLRCSEIGLFLDPGPGERRIRTWSLRYHASEGSAASLLASVQVISHGEAADGSQDVRRAPTTFGYSSPLRDGELAHRVDYMAAPAGPPPPPLTDPDAALVTLDDAPLPGVLLNRNGEQRYWPNRGDGTWGAPRPVARSPGVASFARAGLAFVDMDASGAADLLVAAGTARPGYYENGGRVGFARFVAFPRGSRSGPYFASGQVALTDCDGDGRVDAIMPFGRSYAVWLNGGAEGWSSPQLAVRAASDGPPSNLGDPLTFLADMTGDGLDDIVRVRSGAVEYWPGLGRGRYGPRVVLANSPRLSGLIAERQDCLLADVDGDGCADLVRLTRDGLEVCLNRNGAGFADPLLLRDLPRALPRTLRAANANGRSGTGLLWNSPQSAGRSPLYVALEFGNGQPAYLLNRIENGSGLVSEITYRSAVEDCLRNRASGAEWTTHFPFPYLVVAATRETDQVSAQVVETRYAYHDGHYNPAQRQFQGFGRTERVEAGDGSRPDALTVFRYLMNQERAPGNGPAHAALNGQLARTEIYGLDGTPLQDRAYRVEVSEYGLQSLGTTADGRPRTFVFVRRHQVEDRDRTDDVRVEEKTYTYDATGNVTREVLRGSGVRGGLEQPERVRTTEVAYAVAGDRHRVDRVARLVMRDAGGAILTELRRYYDGQDFVGLPRGQASRGLLTREEHLVLPQAEFEATYSGMDFAALGYSLGADADGAPAYFANSTRAAYDARGVKTADMDAVGNVTTYAYDADGLRRTGLTGGGQTTTFTFDRAIGQPVRVTYPDGKQVRYAYDAQGRAVATALPGESLADPPARYAYDESVIPNARTGRFRAGPGADETLAVTYFDGRGKEFQQRVQVAVGQFVVSGLRRINPWGDLKQEFEPTFSGTSAFDEPGVAGRPSRAVTYDAVGRVLRTVNYNGGVSTATYAPFDVVTRDANDNDDSPENVARGQFDTPHSEEFDVLRFLVGVTEDLGGGAVRRVTYEAGPRGDLARVADDAGVLATYTYDRRGCRLRIVHREAGERRMWYDGRRLVVRTLDAAGNDLRADIDSRGRLSRLFSGGVAIEEYAYDDPARNAVGRLATVRYAGGRQAFEYDAAGRLERHTYEFDGEATPQTLTYAYDRLGRETAVTHTDGTSFTRELTANGWVRRVPGVLDEVTYDPRGLPAEVRYANGVTTEIVYTPGPGRVLSQTVRQAGGALLQQVAYQYDLMEVLLESNDTSPGGRGRESYAYDPLYQLRSVATTEAGAPVVRSYGYANAMNLARLDEAGAVAFYDDALHADRLAGVSLGGQPRVATPHDANGSLLALPRATFGYNAKNELASFAGAGGVTATYGYDHQGVRVSKVVSSGGSVATTRFLGDLVEIRNGQPAYFARLGPARVAVVTGGTTRFAHPDPLGSTAFFTDAGGAKIASIAYHPFGNMAASNGTIDFRTYGVHPFDAESGLVYMRRRYYAPQIGRFLTPDPLALYQPAEYLHNPKALHVYAFVANDPLNKTDLVGLSFWSVVGAIVGVIVAIVVAAAVVMTGGLLGVILGIALVIGIAAVSYVVASATEGTAFGEFMRGFMIGFNAGLNAIIATALFGPVIGIALGVINFLAAFDSVANNSVYQGILGWSSWLMPMSWLATAVGLVFFVLNVIPAIFTGNQVDAVKITSLSLDWKTGTIVMEGGWTFLPGFRGGFNLGNFAYITPGSNVTDHETGHTLNNAAFGSVFHFIGAIDENAIQTTPANALSEQLADSHDPNGWAGGAAGDPLAMWV